MFWPTHCAGCCAALTGHCTLQVVTTEVPVYVDKLVVNEVVKEIEKVVEKKVEEDDDTPIQFERKQNKVQRSGR